VLKINNGNPYVYSLKNNKSENLSQNEFKKILLELEIKRLENEYKRTG
tara:strand:+ start:1471 stop:1614 length:144 start_codon:yes stop_codon:yes gene_type:complete